jgi:hypothetical protein
MDIRHEIGGDTFVWNEKKPNKTGASMASALK